VLSQEEARAFGHAHIGTEHLLIGLLREEHGLAAQTLEGLGMNTEGTRKLVEAAVGRGEEVVSGQIPFTPRCKKVLELALREALSLGHNYVGTEHVLLGLIRENGGAASRVLEDVQIDPATIYNAVIVRLTGRPGGRRQQPRANGAIKLDDQQAAGLFRLHTSQPLRGCQFENGRMRWWLAQGLLIELVNGEWRLSIVPTRRAATAFVSDDRTTSDA
jgi:ATP-dependent Clp protease ATP-binding subunit ClpA